MILLNLYFKHTLHSYKPKRILAWIVASVAVAVVVVYVVISRIRFLHSLSICLYDMCFIVFWVCWLLTTTADIQSCIHVVYSFCRYFCLHMVNHKANFKSSTFSACSVWVCVCVCIVIILIFGVYQNLLWVMTNWRHSSFYLFKFNNCVFALRIFDEYFVICTHARTPIHTTTYARAMRVVSAMTIYEHEYKRK